MLFDCVDIRIYQSYTDTFFVYVISQGVPDSRHKEKAKRRRRRLPEGMEE